MALKIEKWLSTLHGILTELDCSNTINIVTSAKETISNIWYHLEEEYADYEAGLVYSHLFNQENGILCFIQLASEQKVFADHVVIPALILIKNVVESNKCQIWKHVKKIQDFCWNLWRNTEALSQKEIAFEILFLIISLYPEFVDLSLVKSISLEVLNVIPEMAESKPQDLQRLYHMLGVSAKNCPKTLSSINEKIFVALVDGLEMQMKKEGGEIVIAGCFEGITDYLDSFPLSPPKEENYEGNNSLYLKELGEYERRWLMLTNVLRTFLVDSDKSNATTQAGLKFLSKHGSYVSKYLISNDYDNCRHWNKALVKWAGKEIFSEYKLAEAALESLYHEVSLQLLMEPDCRNPLGKVYYMRQYIGVRMMYDEQRAAVKSLGYYTTLLKVTDYQYKIEEIFTYLVQHCERMSFQHPDEFPTSLLMLPVYMEAISQVFGNLEEISIEHVVILQKFSINLIENIPAFHSKWNIDCLRPVIMISYSLSKKPILQEIYLENLLPHALIISCSPLTSSSGERQLELKSVFVDVTICENYLFFWKELFKNPKSSVFRGISAEEYANTVKYILDILLKAALKVIEKLDLRIIANVDEKPIGGPFGSGDEKCDTVNIEMENPKDLQIIANLVLLLHEIISVSDSNMPIRSFSWFMKRVICFSEKNPLISEFYKLLSSCLSYCNSVNYFEVSESTSDQDVVHNNLLNRVVWHLKNILPKVNRFDNGLSLQVSQLEYFLTAPTGVVKHLLKYISFPIQTVFPFGFKYPHLVLMGLEALEKWTSELDWNDWYPILNQILPSLNHLLVESAVCWNKYSGRKISINAEFSCRHSVNDVEPLICQIQEKILSFLAKLPPSFILKIVCDKKMAPTEFSPAWNALQILRFTIPYPNIKTGIALDKILPRIVELSLNSSNGKVRRTASELLFSILMLHFEGLQGERWKTEGISEFCWWLIPSLLQLASDSDAVVGLRFHQLLLHFSNLFSSEHHLKAKTYILWIDCLMDGLSHPHNADIRRISGMYLKTLTIASSKEVVSQESLSEVVGTIVEKICTFSQHSSLGKRVGASLAINCLYSTLCDNPLILDQFWMELLYYQVLALEENESAISKMFISTSLQRLGKVIQSASNIFNKHSMCRKKPPAFEGVLLKDAVYWILKKCGSVDSSCRRESMALYLNLAPFVEGCHSPKDFITLVFERKDAKEMIDILEGSNGLLGRPPWIPDTFHSLQTCSRSDLTSLTKWLNCLNSSLDCYIWCFSENLCDPSLLFQNNVISKIFDALSTFLGILKNICKFINSPVNSFANLKDDMEMVQKIGTLENVFVKIMEYFRVIIEKCQSDVILLQNLGSSWILRIMDIISMYCFEEPFSPTALTTKELQFVFKGFVKSIKKYLSLEINHSLLKCLADSLLKCYDVPVSDPKNIFSCEVSNNQMILTRNLLFLYDCHLLEEIMKDIRFGNFKELNFLKSAFNALFQSHHLKTIYVELSESKLLCIEAFLKSSFLLNSQVKNILALAFDETEVEGLYSQKSMAKGEYFYLSFKSCLLTSLLSNLQISIEYLLEHLKTERGEETLSLWRRIWADLITDEKSKITLGEESLISSILVSIGQLLPWTEGIFIRKLTLLRALLSLPLNVLNQENWLVLEDLGYWCIDLLNNPTESIIIKAKVLRLISFFNHQKYEERLRKALRCLSEKYFSSSGEVTQTLRNCNEAGDIILKSTLIGLENMCNTALLRFFVMASNGRSLIRIDDLKKSLSAMMKKVDPGKQFEAISSIYSLSSDYDCKPDIRIASVKNFLKPLIEVSDLDAAKNFFASNIKDIVKVLQEGLEIASIWLLKPQLVSKIVSFHLVEIIFQRFGKTLEMPSCPISVAYNDGKPNNKELIKELVAKGFDARKIIYPQALESCDLFRQYKCAAYNSLMVIMSSLKVEEKFYFNFFEVNPEDNNIIWEGLIDTSTEIILSRSLEKRTAQLYSTNSEEEQTKDVGSDDMVSDDGCDNFSDISVDDISLLALNAYDFCDCSVRTESRSLETAVGNNLIDQALAEKYIEGIHNHDCLMKICGLIEHMVKKGITPLRIINEDSLSPPVWVTGIKKVFEDRDKHRNIKIFLMAVVLNCEKFYTPYAKHLLTPIMECVANGDFGLSVNHLFANVVELILSWSATVSVPVNGENASKLLEIFFTHQENLEKEKFEHYLSLVRSILRAWHNVIEIHQKKMLKLLEFKKEKYKLVEFGLLVCCNLMEHSVTPWKESYRDRFLNRLLQHLDNNHGSIQMASACLTGLVLRQMDPEGKGLSDEEDIFVAGVIKILSTRSATHKDNFLMCLNEIQRNYFNIIDKFLPEVLYQLPKLKGSYRTICLEMISRRGIAENPFTRLKEAGLFSWLDTEISRDQEIAISIIKRHLSKLHIVELTEIVDHLFHFHRHTNANCRRAMYEILIYICEKHRKDGGSVETENSWLKKSERILLLGFVDDDSTINDVVSCFWKEKGVLSSHNTAVECLVSILLQVFNPDTEKCFLEVVISLFLLLNPLQGKEQHKDGNKEPTSGYLSSKKTLSSPLKRVQGKRPIPKDWQKNKGPNEMRVFQRKHRETRRQHQREEVFESYRSYHVSDFSDIQQAYQNILFLLKALAKDDLVIGRQFLVSLIGGIVETAMTTHDKSSEVWTNLNLALNRILKEASSLSSGFIGAILEISIGKHDFIKLDNEMVVLAGEAASLSPLACLYLESKLINWPVSLQARMLNDKKEAKNDADLWIWLSKLYKHMGEEDVVCGILLHCLNPREEIRKALEFERNECWTEAMPYFQEVLNLSVTGNFIFQERDFYCEGYFRCLANLSQWEQLNWEVSKQLNGSFSRIWDSQKLAENLFPWVFASSLRIELESPGKSEEIFNSVCSWMKNEDRRNYIKAYFSRDVAAVYFLSEEWDQARYFIGNYFDTFLQEWSYFLQGSSKQKMVTALLDIQLLMELSMFLSIFDSPLKDLTHFEKLSSSWMLAPVSHLEPLDHWEERIAFRNICISKMKEAINCGEVGDSLNFSTIIGEVSGRMNQNLIETAIAARNYQVTKKYLKKSELVLRTNSDARLRLPWHLSYGKMSAILADEKPCSSPKKASSFMKSVYVLGELLRDPELCINPNLKISIYGEVFVSLKTLTALVKDHETVFDSVDDEEKKRFFKCIKYSAESQNLMEKITEYGTICMEEAIGIAETLTEKSLLSEVYLSLAKYCLDLMQCSSGNMADVCLKAFLRAIFYGSTEARDWFPCLLLFDYSKSTLREVFKSEISQIPPWMFLGWTNQILSYLNGFVLDALEEIVIKLCEAYPAAILISYRLNFDNYGESVSRMMLNQRINKILSKYKTTEEMIYSLMYICHPGTMLNYHLDKIISLLDSPKPKIFLAKEACSLMMKEMFPSVEEKIFQGKLHDKLQIYKEMLIKLFGSDFYQVEVVKSARSIVASLNCLKKEIKKKDFSSHLEDYSYWLAKFRISDHIDVVEIPGQYKGDSEPLPELHTKICGFSSNVFKVPSLKNSVHITILGTDGREHGFLIEYGQDLRLDQRVGQILHIMNKCLLDNLQSIKRDLRLDISQFIPLSSHHGMIKWNRGFIPLNDVITMSIKEKEIQQRKNALDQYYGWLKKINKTDDSLISIYRNLFLYGGRDETISNYEKLMQAVPCDILRRSFLKLSRSLEDFYCLRNSFASSYAAECIAHWLLGVGKCDYRNIVMHSANGRVSCIDLGRSFGSTVYSFSVPELMPFRLTPQILGLMQPFGEIGFMKEAMVNTLRTLLRRHDIILSVMTVMLKEPSLDWLINFRMDYGIGKSTEMVGSRNWNPEEIIRITQRKFIGGVNPARITMELLDVRINDDAHLKEKIKDVVRGDLNHNVRAVLGNEGLSCEQQVSCLIDLATDYHILGKALINWEPKL